MSGAISRRTFLQAAGATAGGAMAGLSFASQPQSTDAPGATSPRRPFVISSGNGMRATEQAMAKLRENSRPLDAVIAGVNIVEADPDDMSVGYGGLPNEDGVVQLDSSVMDGRTHRAGAVAALEGIMYPSRVAKLVLERTDHVLLVGAGALKFAKAHGFKEENLLTDKAREAWLKWKENLSNDDDWLPPSMEDSAGSALDRRVPFTYGTITCLAVDSVGDMAGVTTTSGLSYKISGRVGDSPIIGAGLYVDNDIGAAGATGRGEAVMQILGSFTVVQLMGMGKSPEEACLEALRIIDRKTIGKRLRDKEGRPDFNVTFYALNKKGDYGAASIWSGGSFALHDGTENRKLPAASLFKKKD